MKMTDEQYTQHHNRSNGYCETCDDVTHTGGIESDAEELECPECEHNTVCGIEQAMLAGFIEIVTEEELEGEEVVSDDEDEDTD